MNFLSNVFTQDLTVERFIVLFYLAFSVYFWFQKETKSGREYIFSTYSKLLLYLSAGGAVALLLSSHQFSEYQYLRIILVSITSCFIFGFFLTAIRQAKFRMKPAIPNSPSLRLTLLFGSAGSTLIAFLLPSVFYFVFYPFLGILVLIRFRDLKK